MSAKGQKKKGNILVKISSPTKNLISDWSMTNAKISYRLQYKISQNQAFGSKLI